MSQRSPVLSGVGETAVGVVPGVSSARMDTGAVRAAVADAELEISPTDGLLTCGSMVEKWSRHAMALAKHLGLMSQQRIGRDDSLGGALNMAAIGLARPPGRGWRVAPRRGGRGRLAAVRDQPPVSHRGDGERPAPRAGRPACRSVRRVRASRPTVSARPGRSPPVPRALVHFRAAAMGWPGRTRRSSSAWPCATAGPPPFNDSAARPAVATPAPREPDRQLHHRRGPARRRWSRWGRPLTWSLAAARCVA